MALLSLCGAALLAIASACAAASSQQPNALGEAGRTGRACTAASMLCGTAFLASAALLAAIVPQSLAASLPAAALLLAALVQLARHRHSPAARAGTASTQALLAQAALLKDLSSVHAAEVVAAHGASRLMSARFAGLLDEQCAAEQTLARISSCFGLGFDAVGAALLAAALWGVDDGPGRVAWAVLQARVAGAALRVGWALGMAAPPTEAT
jgi:hypothetical protein